MEQEVRTFIQKHNLLHNGATVLVGVSGGPDSMALLHFLNGLKELYQLRLIALSIDHGLRGNQSQEDVRYVREKCNTWNIEFYETFIDVPSYKRKEGFGTQLAARKLRYQYFEEQMTKFDGDYLALGHHGDDQAETMLMRFVKSTTPKGLLGIPVKRKFALGQIIRPLLGISKDMIEAYCEHHEIKPRRDPSNEETVYTRNYFRLNVMPLLREQNPNIHKNLQRLSEVINEDEKFLQEQAQEVVEESVSINDECKEASFKIEHFVTYPFALQRRAYHLILNYLYDNVPDGLYYVHEEQFFQLIHNERANLTLDFPNGLLITKSYTRVLFKFKSEVHADSYRIFLDVPGQITLPNGSVIASTFINNPDGDISNTVMIIPELEESDFPLIVRTRKPGDRMSIKGLKGTKKVKDIFIDEKIPKHLRDSWPIILNQKEEILWLVGIKKGNVKDSIDNHRFVRLHYIESNK